MRAARHEGFDRIVFEFRNVLPATPEVVALARSGGFEAVLTWVAGLRDPVDFRVTTLATPPRLIVDVRNH